MEWSLTSVLIGAVIAFIITLPIRIGEEYNKNREYWELKVTWEPWLISLGLLIITLMSLEVWR